MPIISMPDGQRVNFPDDMSREQIRSAILQKYPQLESSQGAGLNTQGKSDILNLFRNNQNNPERLSRLESQTGITLDQVKAQFPDAFKRSGEAPVVVEGEAEDSFRVPKMLAKQAGKGFTGLLDIPAAALKNLLEVQTGLPQEATDLYLKEKLGGATPSEVFSSSVDPQAALEPRNAPERFAGTTAEFMGGGGLATPVLSTLSAGAVQAAREADLDPFAQIALGLAVPYGFTKGASKLTSTPTKAMKELTKSFEQAPVIKEGEALAQQDLPEKVIERAAKAVKGTKGTLEKATELTKKIEDESVKGIDVLEGSMGLRKGADVIDVTENARKLAKTKPLYDKAFLANDGTYIKPDATQESLSLASQLEEFPDYIKYKNDILSDTRNVDRLDKGYAGSLNMYNDIKSKVLKLANRTQDASQADDLYTLGRKIDNLIQTAAPQKSKEALNQATKEYNQFMRKVDNIFGEKYRGNIGALLKFTDADARTQEQIVSQVQKVFKQNPKLIGKAKNLFNQYGLDKNFNQAFSAMMKKNIDELKPNQTFYQFINSSPAKREQFEAALPEVFKGKANKVLKVGENLYNIEKELARITGLDAANLSPRELTGALGQRYQGRETANIAVEFFNNYIRSPLMGKDKINKAVIDLLFDPERGQEFARQFSKLKSEQAREALLMKSLNRVVPVAVESNVQVREENGI